MKRKNLALRMSAYMMSALLVVGSAAPTYAAEEITFADDATDIAVEDAGEAETEVTEDDFADLDLEGDDSETGDAADLFTDEAGETTGDQTGIDTSALEATIAKADALEEMTYTKASWDGNKDAIDVANTAAKAALAAKESQEAVDAANTALTEAMGKLAEAGDPTELKALVEQTKAMTEEDFTVSSVKTGWKSFQTAITNAETAIEERETEQILTRRKNYLNEALENLIKAYDATALSAKIAEAEALKEEDYTADSWKEADLTSAIKRARYAIDTRESKDEIEGGMNDLETAMDTLVSVSLEVTVGRGDFQKKLTPGTYSLPIDLLNAGHVAATKEYTSVDYMKHTSMAAGCFTGDATLVIHEDGSATLTTGLGAVTSDALGTSQSGGADDWSIYESTQDFLDGKANSSHGARFKARIDKQGILGGKRKPTKISFTVPDLKQNVIGTRMHIEIMGVYQDACIGLDWANVKKVSDETSATSTVEKTYDIAPDVQTQLVNMKAGTTVKLDADVTLSENLAIKGGTLDLNGHTLILDQGINAFYGTCHVIDSSADKSGKVIAGISVFISTHNVDSGLILDNVICETPMLQYISIGKVYIINGTKISGITAIDPVAGDGAAYIQDSTWTFADKDAEGNAVNGQALLENTVRTAQYTITKNVDGSFTLAVTDFGKAMRAFEALDESAYTKASYKVAKDLYDEIDVTVDEDLTEEQIKGFQDAVAALQAAATESDITALNDAITAAKALNASDYTAASYKTLSDAVSVAEALLASDDLGQADVTAAVQAINDATAALVKVQDQTITISVKNSKGTVSKKFGDKAFSLGAKAKGGLTYKSSNTKIATVDSKGKVTIKAAGTVKITITAKATGDYKSATKTVTVKVAKVAPSIKTKTGSKTFKYATVKKKAQTFTLGASTNSKGKLTFKKLSKTCCSFLHWQTDSEKRS